MWLSCLGHWTNSRQCCQDVTEARVWILLRKEQNISLKSSLIFCFQAPAYHLIFEALLIIWIFKLIFFSTEYRPESVLTEKVRMNIVTDVVQGSVFVTALKTYWWPSAVVCSVVGLLSLWHIPYFHSQFYK